MTKQTVPVSMRALIARINRRIRKDGDVLKAARGERAQLEVGDYYMLRLTDNAIVGKDVRPEELGRELGVLRPYERLVAAA